MKKIFITILIVLIISSIAYLAYIFVFSVKVSIPSDMDKKEGSEISSTTSPLSDDDLLDQALSGQKAEKCLEISGEDVKNYCLNELALKLSDVTMCGQITVDEARASCFNMVAFNSATAQKDVKACERISDEDELLQCIEDVFNLGIEKNQCNEMDVKYASRTQEDIFRIEPRDMCFSLFNYAESIEKSDIDLCSQVAENNLRAQCMTAITQMPMNDDSDKDDLGYYYEIFYKSDPKKADTDGDGYKDGEEVKSGYDPAVAGGVLGYIPLKTFR